MSINTYFCLSSPFECLPLDVHTCIFICEYMYVCKQVRICAEREWGCDAHAGCRSGHLQFQPTWHPLPQYGFGEQSFHRDQDAFVTKDAHLLTAKGQAPSPSPRLSPRTGILNRKIIKAEIHPTVCALKNSLCLLQPGSPRCRPRGILSGPQK